MRNAKKLFVIIYGLLTRFPIETKNLFTYYFRYYESVGYPTKAALLYAGKEIRNQLKYLPEVIKNQWKAEE